MNINKNFVGARMNKSLDERLIPPGEYIDALNIRISSDEGGEGFSAENAKGNELLVVPKYDGASLSNPKCIGAYEDGVNETIYWFVASDDYDMILSYNTRNESIIYHVISSTVLNFNKKYLVNGINKIDDFIFFTDNYNQPRRINVKSSYPHPVGGVDQITEDDISVIVKPPFNAPSVDLFKIATKQNYIEDKFIRFSYRYKYKNGEYSALSEFSDLAFRPGQFRLDYGNYDMVGMKNSSNIVNVSFNTGPSDVVGVDLCFKLSNSSIINVIEKYNKKDKGWTDDDDVSVEFNNQKIYTTLPQSELLRVYDNVPKRAKAQTTIGNRIMYGNYYDGYDVDTVINYEVELINEDIGFSPVLDSKSDGVAYTISGGSVTVSDSVIDIDLTGVDLLEGGSINIDFNIQHDSFGGDASYVDGSEVENDYIDSFEFVFPRDYSSVEDLATDPDFLKAIELTDTVGFPGTISDGYSLSDLFYSGLTMHASGDWVLSGGGITSSPQGFVVTYSGDTISLQVPSVEFEDSTNPGTYAYEYFVMSSITVSITENSSRQSLHSNRDYEVGIVYLDEYNRASTALVCETNTVFVEPQNSTTKNSIRATINHIAPSWAKRYRFVMKPSKGGYETVYSNQYYFSPEESAWWVKLEGDNQTKFQNGERLIVKRSSSGPVADVVKAKVLDLKTQERWFIDEAAKLPPTSGVYMKLKPTGYSISEPELADIDKGAKSKKNGYGIAYPTYIEDPDNAGTYINYTLPAGTEVRISFSNNRFGSGYTCGSRYFKFDRTFTATRDYDNFYDFIIGENIDFNNPTNNPGPESSDNTTPSADFDTTIGAYSTIIGNIFSGGYNAPEGVTGIRWSEAGTLGTSDYRSYLTFTQAGGKCNGRNYWLNVHIQVFRAGGLLIFETEPEENANEIYYESFESYPITAEGYHTSNNQNQTNSLPAIVDLNMYNCFTFGNGAESYKIEDGLARPGFKMGARVTAVSEQDYKESHRYADITYSGVYNEETNLNKLNEFNLGLVNFSSLEKSFGPIEVMHARQSDILALQEDKISYVLANGKNLFSDAQAGGAILSTPEVLGQQVPRIEDFGISNNAESFSVHGFDVFFTDAKRGAVINLKGGQGPGDQLNVISSLGMRSWFRDRFLNNINKIHLGGYDPYMNEYVLSITDDELDIQTDAIDCGFTVSQQSSSNPLTYTVNIGDYTADVPIDYNVTTGSVDVLVTYNGIDLINETITGTGQLLFTRDEYGVNECTITLTPSTATYELDFGCPIPQELTIIKIVKNTDQMSGQTIHHGYRWSDGAFTSPNAPYAFSFGDGPVSYYDTVTGVEGSGVIPVGGGVVTMSYKKIVGDTADWIADKFKYLVSDTLYTAEDIETLTPLLQEASPIENPDADFYTASFTYSNPSNYAYLYLVWDYVEPEIECTDTLSVTGFEGVYEFLVQLGTKTGPTTLTFNSINIPDRFQIEYNNAIVADSLFVGDSLPNTTYQNQITAATSLPLYEYDGSNFVQNGTTAVSFLASDISDYTTSRPTSGDGSVGNQVGVVGGYPSGTPLASDGDVKLTFNKDYAYPTYIKVIVTGVNGSTQWNITDIDCPSGEESTYITPQKIYHQYWAWVDDVDPLGGGTNGVLVVQYDDIWYLWLLPGMGGIDTIDSLGFPLSLSSNDENATTLLLLRQDFEQGIGAVLNSTVPYNYTSLNSNEYPIIDN